MAKGPEVGRFKYGVPTKHDVTDPKYHHLLKLSALDRDISPRRLPSLGENLPVDHVDNALDASGQYLTFRMGALVPAHLLLYPDNLRIFGQALIHGSNLWQKLHQRPTYEQFLAPHDLADQQIGLLNNYREKLAEAEPFLPKVKTIQETYDYTPEVIPPMDSVKVVDQVTGNQGEPRFKYRYQPWEVMNEYLDSLETDIQGAVSGKGSAIDKIRRFNEIVSPAESWDGIGRFLNDDFTILSPLDTRPETFEKDPASEVGKLALVNREIAANSDISLDFRAEKISFRDYYGDADFSVFEGNEGSVFDKFEFMHRGDMRDVMKQHWANNQDIVIAGIPIRAEGYVLSSDQEIPQWIVDLAALPAVTKYNVSLPADWSSDEELLVAQLRTLTLEQVTKVNPSNPIVDQIDKQYGFRKYYKSDADVRYRIGKFVHQPHQPVKLHQY